MYSGPPLEILPLEFPKDFGVRKHIGYQRRLLHDNHFGHFHIYQRVMDGWAKTDARRTALRRCATLMHDKKSLTSDPVCYCFIQL